VTGRVPLAPRLGSRSIVDAADLATHAAGELITRLETPRPAVRRPRNRASPAAHRDAVQPASWGAWVPGSEVDWSRVVRVVG
jgi:hypothetical protein